MERLAAIAFLMFGVFQLGAAYAGVEYCWGSMLALVVIILSLGLGFTLPISIGAWLGAVNVWHWHWALALAFVAPGLLFVIPGFIAVTLSTMKGQST